MNPADCDPASDGSITRASPYADGRARPGERKDKPPAQGQPGSSPGVGANLRDLPDAGASLLRRTVEFDSRRGDYRPVSIW